MSVNIRCELCKGIIRLAKIPKLFYRHCGTILPFKEELIISVIKYPKVEKKDEEFIEVEDDEMIEVEE